MEAYKVTQMGTTYFQARKTSNRCIKMAKIKNISEDRQNKFSLQGIDYIFYAFTTRLLQ